MEQVKRRYRSPRRDEQARATRRAILDGAEELFSRQGFAETSIREIAEHAGVSEQTVYNGFKDKVGLLVAIVEDYSDLASGERDAEFLAALEATDDTIDRIRMVARSSRELWEQGTIELERVVFGHDRSDPRLARLADEGLALKLKTTRAICEVLFPDDIRRPGLELSDIADFATAVDSAATITTLQALGWSVDRYEAWLVELLLSFVDPQHR